jgi:hypothetical protein
VSLANVRAHWRFLVTLFVLFLALLAAGPLLFYGLPRLLGGVFDRFGSASVLVMGLIFAAAALGWLFFVLWAGDKADRLALGDAPPEEERNG